MLPSAWLFNFFFLILSPAHFFVFPEVQCPKLNVEIQLRACSCAHDQPRLCSPVCDPDIPRYTGCPAVMVFFLSQAITDAQLAFYTFQS